MAEYYNRFDEQYVYACNQAVKPVRIKFELLNWNEQVVGEINSDIVNTNGNINIEYLQGVRRSCELSIIDKSVRYLPSSNSPFWYKKKFKLYVGIVFGDNTYYWSQGVFLIKTLSISNYVLNVSGIDKFGLFDGSLNLMKADVQYNAIANAQNSVFGIIQETLLLDCGNGDSIDPIMPIIDFCYKDTLLQADIGLDSGNYIGDLLVDFAKFYGADIYYDTDGHLIFHKMFGENRVSAYQYIGSQWFFNDKNSVLLSHNNNYNLDGHNRVRVYTNADNMLNYEYVATNTNPASDLNISAVGVRSLDDEEVTLTVGISNDDCRQYAEYLLSKECRMSINGDISCGLLPHLNVNQIVQVSNSALNLNTEKFIINTITLPLGNEPMTLNVSNLQMLPDFTCNVTI